jgi:hypothetical protein
MTGEPTDEQLLARLRDAVNARRGEWTTADVAHTLGFQDDPAFWGSRGRARTLLDQLTAEGLLVRTGDPGFVWTVPPAHRGGPDIGPDAEDEYRAEKADYTPEEN